jgi:DNA-binding NtrC family response regulator
MATRPINVLVVDDDTNLVRALVELLAQAGYHAEAALTAEEALERCRDETYHLVLTDLQLPGRNGIALIKTLAEACPDTKSVLITAHGSIRSAVTALKRGAVEYMTKPIKPRRLLALIAALTADSPPYLSNRLLLASKLPTTTEGGLTARSRGMQDVFERIRLAAQSDTAVLITGESGTGKGLTARAIHDRSSSSQGPFVDVHLGALPREQVAAELFGQERPGEDAQPGKVEQAEGGTLFLDEIWAMDEPTQVSLLRLLESSQLTRIGGKKDHTAHVRVIGASSRDLEELVKAGQFREDLYYRLATFAIQIPPLRDRIEDLPVLATEFLQELAVKYGRPAATIPSETQRLLQAYAWPGNVRELRNVIEQSVLLARGPELSPLLLPQMLHRAPSRTQVIKIPIGTAMDQVEREVILRTLEANDGNKTATAEVLGISRRSIYNKLAVYGLTDEQARS